MLSLINVALRRGTELLFEDVSFTITKGKKVGLIGANGAGKTSLFKLILGELDSDLGEVDYPAATRIAHLAQEVPGTSQAAIEYVLAGDDRLTAIEEALVAAEREERYVEIAELHDRLANIDGYTARARAEQLLVGLGFMESEFAQPLSSFSGGWRIRLNLARTLMAPSDLLLLDEPTNHLDLDAILWLSDWIKRYQGTMLLISHDREFLDESVDSIAYLHRKRIEIFTGNYSQFERIKAERLAEQQSNYEKQQREIRHMQDFISRFRYKASKARQAQSRIKALERMELIAPAHIDSPFRFEIPASDRVSTPLLSLDRATLGYGDVAVLQGVRVSLEPGDRIGLLGHNGAGKSTLVKTLRGELSLLDGERTEGQNLTVGYFSQHQVDELDLGGTALSHIAALDDKLPEQVIRNFLGGFDFQGDKVKAPVGTFSGGEKARLALAIVAHSRPNLLLMDEPTNHLDMDMRQALTVALQDFDGAIVLISHDRHLLANSVDEFLLVHAGRVESFKGDLEDYRKRVLGDSRLTSTEPSSLKADRSNTAAPKATSKRSDARALGNRQTQQLKSELGGIEKRLTRLTRKLAEIESSLASNELYTEGGGGADLQSLLREQVSLKEEIEGLEEDWLRKSEALEQGTGSTT
ncbi:MAG: ATP-binding cassette domain-containing protein [Pseudomonadales bacterium]|nr:ATP-binding cassette domain-containing protein [Pseudomonadales bacterium]